MVSHGKSIKLARDVLPYEASNENPLDGAKSRISLGAMSSAFYLDEV